MVGDFDMQDLFNSTTMGSTSHDLLPTQRTSVLMKWYATVVINPIIGVVGILGNTLTCIILRQCGFSKPSNVFLFGLAISDICALVPAVDPVYMLTQFQRRVPLVLSGWEYECQDPSLVEFYLVVKMIVFGVSIFGMNVSQCMCVVITIERLVAIFLPLKFQTIVRPKRALAVVGCLYLLWLGLTIVYLRKFEFNFSYFKEYQTCVGSYHVNLNEDEILFDTISSWLACYVSLGIIIVGSIVIFAKIKSVTRSRGEMTSSKTASCSRTTRTLLAVCVLFSCMQILRYPYAMGLPFPDQETFLIYFVFVTLAANMNSASNFIIYVILNTKFRKLLLNRMSCI